MANINHNRVMKSLVKYSQTELELLMSAVQNEMNKRDKSLENKTTAFSLPGTRGFETSNEEKMALQMRASELGIMTAYYDEWEIVQFGNAVADSRDNLWIDGFARDVYPLYGYVLEANRLIAEIAGYVRRTPGKLWNEKNGHKIFPFNETDVGSLSKVRTEISLICERLNLPPDEPLPTLISMSEGLYQLINWS
jgi:hypothetical protein